MADSISIAAVGPIIIISSTSRMWNCESLHEMGVTAQHFMSWNISNGISLSSWFQVQETSLSDKRSVSSKQPIKLCWKYIHAQQGHVVKTYLAKPAYTLAHSTSKLRNEYAQTELIVHGKPPSQGTQPGMSTYTVNYFQDYTRWNCNSWQ